MRKLKLIIFSRLHAFKSSSLKKKLLIIVILIITGIIITQIIASATKKPDFETVKAVNGNIIETVSETGIISTNGRIDIYSPTNGVVESLSVQNGMEVEKGQELFKVVSSATDQEKAESYATLLSAKSALDNANATLFSLRSTLYGEWKTYTDLATNSTYENEDGSPKNDSRNLPEFTTAQAEWQAAEADYKNQQGVIASAQAAYNNASLKYAATQNATVKAQNPGRVANLSVRVGSTVQAKTPTSTIPPVLTVANFTTTEAIIMLGEANISKIKEGQTVSLDVSSINDKTFKGVVTRVDTIANNNNGVMEYAVYTELLNPDENIRPGMTVDAKITTNELANVLTVPNSAVKPYQGGRAVRVMKNKKIEYVPVKIGIRGESKTQILSGIKEGQEVITQLSNEQLKRPGLFGN